MRSRHRNNSPRRSRKKARIDPIWSDPDAEEKMHADMLDFLAEMGAPPEIVYAYEKTNRVVLPINRHMITPAELDEWDAAIAEYHARPHADNRWSPSDVQEIILDPRTVGVGDFPPIVDEETWISVQVKQIEELGPERYVRYQLDVLHKAFAGYGDMLVEHLFTDDEIEDEEEHDPRTTEEIRQDYLVKKQEFANDPVICEVCDAGLVLLEAEVGVRDAVLDHRSQAQRTLHAAQIRMDAAVAALREQNIDALRDWYPGEHEKPN